MQHDSFEDAVNDLSDRDSNWWPFLWLRPEKHEELTLLRLIALSILYGLPCGALLGTIARVVGEASTTASIATVVAFPLVCLFAGTVVIAPMWNRRAARLLPPQAAEQPDGD